MLGWSINLFKVFGIQLAVHASFFLLLAYFGYEGWRDAGMVGLIWSVALILLFFICVVLHELGHSLTARRFGVRVPRILLLPIGGMAEFDRIPRRPSEELLITAAGPLVNFVLAALLLPLTWSDLTSAETVSLYSLRGLVAQLSIANLYMGVFNLIPVFPMDGGRILRALLAKRLPYLRATRVAVNVARVLAPLLAIAALYFNNVFLCVLFVFIYFAGNAEYQLLLRREREAEYWAGIARRLEPVQVGPEDRDPPPLSLHGPN